MTDFGTLILLEDYSQPMYWAAQADLEGAAVYSALGINLHDQTDKSEKANFEDTEQRKPLLFTII